MITALSERMRQLMAEKKWSIQYLANIAGLPEETVKNLYYARTPDPKISTIMKLSQAFNISVNCLMGQCQHTPEERAILRNYRACGKHGKSVIELIARYEAGSVKSERESADKHSIPCLVPQGDIRKGIVYDNCETIEIVVAAPDAYVGIMMNNNDLAPMYCKDDIILFENRFPKHGEYAAFFRDGKAYIRKFIEEDKQYRLKCLHSQGTDIVLKRMDEIEYIGTCIDVIRS